MIDSFGAPAQDRTGGLPLTRRALCLLSYRGNRDASDRTYEHAPHEARLGSTHEVVLPLFSPAARGPTKKYRTIVADPPWPLAMGPTLTEKHVKPSLGYPTMTLEELRAVPVGLWAPDRAHLYLWVPNALVDVAIRLCDAWGFRYSTLLTWIKRRMNGDAWVGLGRYYRSTTEHVVFGVRGGLAVLHNDQPNFFFAARGIHSEKPAAFYDMVERMSPGPYLDVFARKQRFNWDTWGDEAFDFRTDGMWG